MGIIDRLKRRLPIIGSPPPSPAAYTPPRPTPRAREEEAEAPAPVSARGAQAVPEYIAQTVEAHPVVLFMKGTATSPLCGFSANAAGILSGYGVPLHTVDVIADPEVREGIKQFTNWPTIPQVFVGGEFVGGADILTQLHESGELGGMIQKAAAAP